MAERLKKPEQLIKWLEEEDMLFSMSLKEAGTMLGYLEGSGYGLETEMGVLFLCDNVEDAREKTGIDEVLDMVCEKNYELIEQTTVKISKAGMGEDTREEEAYLASLMEDETVLDHVFERTRYQKETGHLLQETAGDRKPRAAFGGR